MGEIHDELVERAGRWLRNTRRCKVVLLEAGYGGGREIPDAIGFTNYTSIVIECKATRSDFLRDFAKRHRSTGMGQERWYLAFKGILDPEEIPDGWGLLELSGNRILKTRHPNPVSGRTVDGKAQFKLLLGALALVQHEANGWVVADTRHVRANLCIESRGVIH